MKEEVLDWFKGLTTGAGGRWTKFKTVLVNVESGVARQDLRELTV
jgi:hypothetical protein